MGVLLFGAFFVLLVLLYIWRWNVCLYSLHSLWIGGLIGIPMAALLYRTCESFHAPLDVLTLLLLTWK